MLQLILIFIEEKLLYAKNRSKYKTYNGKKVPPVRTYYDSRKAFYVKKTTTLTTTDDSEE